MPTYEYACRSCGTHVEVFQRISDEPPSVCLHCGGQLRKVFHPAGILLKGSGFYKTDNRAKSKSSSSSDSSSSSSSGATDTSKSSDTAGSKETPCSKSGAEEKTA